MNSAFWITIIFLLCSVEEGNSQQYFVTAAYLGSSCTTNPEFSTAILTGACLRLSGYTSITCNSSRISYSNCQNDTTCTNCSSNIFPVGCSEASTPTASLACSTSLPVIPAGAVAYMEYSQANSCTGNVVFQQFSLPTACIETDVAGSFSKKSCEGNTVSVITCSDSGCTEGCTTKTESTGNCSFVQELGRYGVYTCTVSSSAPFSAFVALTVLATLFCLF